jgi:hypothetical protein
LAEFFSAIEVNRFSVVELACPPFKACGQRAN